MTEFIWQNSHIWVNFSFNPTTYDNSVKYFKSNAIETFQDLTFCNNIKLVGFYMLKRSSIMFEDNGWRDSHHKGAQLSAASWTDFADLAVTAEMYEAI